MKKLKHKALSLFLAAIMLIGIIPATAFAADETQEVVPSVGTATGERLSDYSFAPGTYMVTANIVVPGKSNMLGKDAYPTNMDNPGGTADDDLADVTGVIRKNIPTMGVENNAELTVSEDGKMSITVSVPNPVFTIQQIDGCTNAEITNTVEKEKKYGSRTSRITEITAALDDAALYNWTESVKELNKSDGSVSDTTMDLWGAIYTFSDCKEHPTLIPFPSMSNWTAPLELRIDFSNVLKSVNLPETENKLVYNGKTQTGVTAGEHYTLTGDIEASNAGKYTAVATPDADYAWEDGSRAPKEICWEITPALLTAEYAGESIAYDGEPELKVEVKGFVNGETDETASGYVAPSVKKESFEAGKSYELIPSGGRADNYTFRYVAGTLKIGEKENQELLAGTYRMTANLYVPGELNGELGVNAYLTNPNNPLGIGGHAGLPTEPVTDNAVLVVGKDGSRTIILDVVNPVFTLQKIGNGSNIRVLFSERDNETYGGNNGVSRSGRITKIYAALDDESGTYQFENCVEFPTLLEQDWTIPVRLNADFSSAVKISEETDADVPEQPEEPGNDSVKPENPKADPDEQIKADNEEKPSTSGESKKVSGSQNKTKTVTVNYLKQGTYTVTCNIWFSKEDCGLPMNPYITNSTFPPKDPVKNNATLIVDKNGRARVIIPISVQSKIMNIKEITGLNIIDSERNADGYYTSITVDLGILKNPQDTIIKYCKIDLTMGDLAMSISNLEGDQSWPATLKLDLSGVMTRKAVENVAAPQTGDTSNVILYLAAVVICGGGLAAAGAVRRKYKVH